jgi:nuclear pore complex protein Nup210
MHKFLLITLLSILTTCESLKFNKPRILLPIFNEVNINYQLEVIERGCFNFR